jgi:O-antigen/teichoic acid export membrane protein
VSANVGERRGLTQWFTVVTFPELKRILHESFPFWVFFVLSVIYFKADILMLATMQGDVAVGLYESAYKFIEASMFVPVSIINVLLPVMSRMFVTDKSAGHHVYIHASRLLAISILPVVIGISFFSRDIISLVFKDPNYLPAAPALSLLIWALLIIFLNAPVGNTIASSDRVHAYLPYAIGNTLLNIVLNVWFIRRYSYMGAAFTTVLTECTGFASQLWFAHRIMGGAPDILKILAKLLIAGGMTSLVLAIVKPLVLFPFNALLAGIVYIACLLGLKLIDKRGFLLVREEIQRFKARHLPGK